MRGHLYKLSTYSASAVLVMMIATVITGYLSTASAAEDDAVKKLIGTWKGTQVITFGTANNNRILVIESVKRDGEQWVAAGRYGIVENPPTKFQISVTLSGNDVVLDFNTLQGKVPIHLKLEGANELNGYARVQYPQRTVNENLNLKRIE